MLAQKKYLFIGFLIILSAAVLISGCVIKQTPPLDIENINGETGDLDGIGDQVSDLLEKLKTRTGIRFSDAEEVEFNWYVEKGKNIETLSVKGKGFEAKKISDKKYAMVGPFLEDNSFKVNMYNVSDGTVSGAVGYEKGQLVCIVAGGISGYKEASGQWDPEGGIYTNDIEVKCGKRKILTEENIQVKEGDKFSISLEANPTTGYQWQVHFDPGYIKLIDNEYIPDSPGLVGSGGKEVFNFTSLEIGTTEISFSYLRPWEEVEPIEERVFTIIVE